MGALSTAERPRWAWVGSAPIPGLFSGIKRDKLPHFRGRNATDEESLEAISAHLRHATYQRGATPFDKIRMKIESLVLDALYRKPYAYRPGYCDA